MTEEQHVQELRREADEVTDQSLEATRRMKQMAGETEQIGNETLGTLAEQGEQLNRIERGVDNVNQNIKEAEKELTDLEKCCGCCTCPWQRKAAYQESKSFGNNHADDRAEGKGKTITSQPGATAEPSGMKRITNDAREDEMEDNLNTIGDIVGNLKNQANEMNKELVAQNKQLDRIDDKMTDEVNRLDTANKRTNEILKS